MPLLAALLCALAAVFLLPLLLILASTIFRDGRWYAYRDTASAQVQACGLSLQIGAFLIGWAPASWFSGRARSYAPTRLVLWSPSDCAGRVILQMFLLGHGFSWRTANRGSSWSYPGPGLRLV